MSDTGRYQRPLLSEIYGHLTFKICIVLTQNLWTLTVSITAHLTVKIMLIRTQSAELSHM